MFAFSLCRLSLAVPTILDCQHGERGDEHEERHEEVARVEGACLRLEPAHHVGADPAAEVAAGVDEGDAAGGGGAGEEACRDRPPDAHGGVDADGGQADEEERRIHVIGKGAEPEADGADEESARDVPDLVPRLRRGLADDDLHEERRRHRNGDGAAEESGRPARKPLEHRRHPEVEAPEADDPHEIDEAELQDLGIGESLKDRVLLDALHTRLLFFVLAVQVFLFFCAEPGNLVGLVLDEVEEKYGEEEGGHCLQDEQFLPAVHAEEGCLQQESRERCADDR